MSMGRRLEALEGRVASERPIYNEVEEKHRWLSRRHMDRSEATSEEARHARSLIGLFRVQDRLPAMSAEELIERIVSWRPPPAGGRSRTVAEREVALAIYNQEPGTKNMVCPSRWRESLEAGDELRAKYNAIPEEVLAEGYVRLGQIGGEGQALEEWSARYEEAFGITDELVRRAVGPDVYELSEEEHAFRLHEYLADAMYGEKSWRIRRHIDRLAEEETV